MLAANSYNIDHDVGIFFFNKIEELEKKKNGLKFDAVNDLLFSRIKLFVNSIAIPMRTDSGFVAFEIKPKKTIRIWRTGQKLRSKV